MRTLRILLATTMVALSSHAIADIDVKTLTTDIQHIVEENDFNGVVLVANNEKILIRTIQGFADAEKRTSLTQDHLFSPGSVGKEFTAVSVMQLVQQGKLSYQDSVVSYIDDLPESLQKITIEHIMTHTSGLPRIKWKRGINTDDVISQIKHSEPAFAPGSDYLYSNVNVVLRALVVEAVTDTPYQAYVKDTIFSVAGMSSAYQQTDVQGASELLVAGDYPTAIKGVTIYVTPDDLLKFEQALIAGKLLPFPDVQQSLTGDNLSGQEHRARFDFGFFNLDDNGALLSWQHDGSNPSHHTLKYHHFGHGITMVAMSSDGNKSLLFAVKEAVEAHFSDKKI